MAVGFTSDKADLSEAILDAAGPIIFAVDLDGRVIRWNRAAAALTGISANEIRGHVFHEIVLFPGDKDHWRREFERISTGDESRYFECRWKINDSSFALLTCSCSVIRGPAGKSQYLVCTATNSFTREFMTDRTAELRDISHFLHNTVSQDLVALAFNLNQLETAPIGAPWRADAESARRLIDRCCRDIRVISYMLAPPSLSETTLEASIAQHADFVREETGLAIALDLDPVPDTVSSEAQLLLFAAVQSWVGHGIRSGAEPAISVRLRVRSGGVVLEMEMVPPALVVSLRGWVVIRERARALGGEFDIAGDLQRITARMSLPGRTDEQ
jgi:PAS domain S-box-containing protein